jgi:hypothetical protein
MFNGFDEIGRSDIFDPQQWISYSQNHADQSDLYPNKKIIDAIKKRCSLDGDKKTTDHMDPALGLTIKPKNTLGFSNDPGQQPPSAGRTQQIRAERIDV